MHSKAFLVSLLAAGVVASPVLAKRVLVTEVEVVTDVVYVTKTEGAVNHRPTNDIVWVTKTVGGGQQATQRPRPVHHRPQQPAAPQPTPQAPSNPPPQPQPHQPPPPQDDSYEGTVVAHHNVHRANHSAANVEWDAGLASTAQKIAETCIYEHNTEMDGGGYGQNIAAGVPANNISAIISDMFYNGEINNFGNQYGNPNPSGFEGWGHFSQVIWKGTTHVACATVDCSSRGLANVDSLVPPVFTVCNYKNPGNYAGEYAENLGVPLGHPTVGWAY